ncbi:MAG: apolipoprotein N-acyltransferase [Pseudomonadota bacterium]
MNVLNLKMGLALLAGALCVFGFAPFGHFVVPVLALAVLFALWRLADSPRTAAWIGFAFGLGLFGVGISWVYVALHDYGHMSAWLAVPATLMFSAFIGLFPALAGYAQARFARAARLDSRDVCHALPALMAMAAIWVAMEWLRGTILTGFPWLTLGYAHSDSPLAGYAPLLGVYGVSLLAAVSAALLALLWQLRRRRAKFVGIVLLAVWAGGAALRGVAWTQPVGETFSVALLQGNIDQNEKFADEGLIDTLETYRRLVLESDARLIVLPETALPMLREELPPTLLTQLRNHAVENAGDVLLGAFWREGDRYYNSVFSTGEAAEQSYHKQHLVPFGEFIPLRPLLGWFINGVLNIPMGDLANGGTRQQPLNVAGQRVAVNICYEDVFGEEIIRALPAATLLVNVTNDAWYGDSYAAAQHNQISQLRALESGRMMLRATNTGVTSIIDANGKVLQQLPEHEEGVLRGIARGYQGSTPYVIWSNWAVLSILIAMLAYVRVRGARNKSTARGGPV